MVGSAVATIVWSSAASSMPSISAPRIARILRCSSLPISSAPTAATELGRADIELPPGLPPTCRPASVSPSARLGCRLTGRQVGAGSASLGYGHLAEHGPAILRDRNADDPRSLHQVRWQRLLRGPEVLGLDMRGASRVIAESLDQNILAWVVHASGPVEPQAARLSPRRLGKRASDLRPPVGILWLHTELRSDEDHEALSSSRGGNDRPDIVAYSSWRCKPPLTAAGLHPPGRC